MFEISLLFCVTQLFVSCAKLFFPLNLFAKDDQKENKKKIKAHHQKLKKKKKIKSFFKDELLRRDFFTQRR